MIIGDIGMTSLSDGFRNVDVREKVQLKSGKIGSGR